MRVARIVSLFVLGVAVIAPMRAQAQGDTTHRAVSQTAKRTGTRAAKRTEQAALRAEAKISLDSATKIALARVPNGKVREHELEREKGTVVYSFDIKVPNQSGVEEVLVSAIDGSVVSQEHESAKKEKAEMKAEKQEAKPKKP